NAPAELPLDQLHAGQCAASGGRGGRPGGIVRPFLIAEGRAGRGGRPIRALRPAGSSSLARGRSPARRGSLTGGSLADGRPLFRGGCLPRGGSLARDGPGGGHGSPAAGGLAGRAAPRRARPWGVRPARSVVS